MTDTPPPPAYGYAADKEALIKRLHRIEGQVRGIERMLTEDRYRIDMITQIAAIQTAIQAVAFKILDEHVNHCVAGALASGDQDGCSEEPRAARRGPSLQPHPLTSAARLLQTLTGRLAASGSRRSSRGDSTVSSGTADRAP